VSYHSDGSQSAVQVRLSHPCELLPNVLMNLMQTAQFRLATHLAAAHWWAVCMRFIKAPTLNRTPPPTQAIFVSLESAPPEAQHWRKHHQCPHNMAAELQLMVAQ
jgi:hypothetical protein